MRQQTGLLTQLEVDVAVVTFEQPERAAGYAREIDLAWPLLLDQDRRLFMAYGMERGTTAEVMGWSNWGIYFELFRRGRRLRRPTGDVYQLGGNVLIDRQGIVRFHHVGRGPADRPSVETLLVAAGHVTATASSERRQDRQ